MNSVAKRFLTSGSIIQAVHYGNGIINETYLIEHQSGKSRARYILRKMNKFVFRNPEIAIQNSFYASCHIRNKLINEGENDTSRKAITLIPADDRKYYVIDDNKDYWCMITFIERAFTLDYVSNANQAYLAAKAFGKFIRQLSDDDNFKYKAAIPDFHNTPYRIDTLKKIIADTSDARLNEAEPEIRYLLEYETYFRNIASIKLPLRLTHNDTKISNVLFDCDTKEGICVIDLDTVMPGYVIHDFGDLIRTAAATEDENHEELNKVKINTENLEAITKGFLEETESVLTTEEKDNLIKGAEQIIYEQAIRFITDYLIRDQYYKTKHPQQNLIRTRNQIQLLKSLLN